MLPDTLLLPTRSVEATRAASRPRLVRDVSPRYRPDIDGLRAIAVALVVAYHALPGFLSGGFIGVDVFFVISGYLITQIILSGLRAGTFSLGAFYQRRVRRIIPALLVVLAACALFGWLTLFSEELQWLGRSIAYCASFLANLFFARLGSGYFDRGAQLTPLLHLWSLGVEEQFYFAWPLLIMLAARRGVTMRVLLVVTATSLAINIWGIWHAPIQYFYLPASRAWELAAGGMLAAWQAGMHRAAGADTSAVRSLHRLAGGKRTDYRRGGISGCGRLASRDSESAGNRRYGIADPGGTAGAGEPSFSEPPADGIRRAD